jgi:hypothetical protein
MARWTIPEPLPIDWTMRDPSSARIAVRTLADGRLEQVVEHAPLPGVTPDMMLWMLANMGREIEWRGRRCLVYRLWHPRDHIHFAVLGAFGPGCRFHIVEAFQARPEYLRDLVYDVPKLDRTGFCLELRVLGQVVGSADEAWDERPEGMGWRVRVVAGLATPGLRALNPVLRRRQAALLAAWRRHNVEEDGNLPHVLPALYARYAP